MLSRAPRQRRRDEDTHSPGVIFTLMQSSPLKRGEGNCHPALDAGSRKRKETTNQVLDGRKDREKMAVLPPPLFINSPPVCFFRAKDTYYS